MNHKNNDSIPRNQLVAILLLIMWVSCNCYSQSGTITGTGTVTYNADGSVTVSGTKIFTSHVSIVNESVDNMLQMDVIRLFNVSADLTGGIKARMGDAGKVTLSIYAFDNSSATKKGGLLYRIKTQTTSPESFIGNPELVPSPMGTGTINSDQIKVLTSGCNAWIVDKTRVTGDINLFKSTMAYINGNVNPLIETSLNNELKGNNYKLTQPVILEVAIENATLMKQG